jgi:hypothetical protein
MVAASQVLIRHVLLLSVHRSGRILRLVYGALTQQYVRLIGLNPLHKRRCVQRRKGYEAQGHVLSSPRWCGSISMLMHTK